MINQDLLAIEAILRKYQEEITRLETELEASILHNKLCARTYEENEKVFHNITADLCKENKQLRQELEDLKKSQNKETKPWMSPEEMILHFSRMLETVRQNENKDQLILFQIGDIPNPPKIT